MDMRELLQTLDNKGRERLAARAKTTVGYLYIIAGGHRKPGPALCDRLVKADGRLTKHELRPDFA